MGGKALNKYGVTTVRKSTDEFYRIANEVCNRIRNDLSIETYVTKFCKNKNEHGDVDVLLKFTKSCNGLNLKEYIYTAFTPKAVHVNDSVYSFDYDDFQVDLVIIPELSWEMSKYYMDYDPRGNLLGKIAHKFNLSFGHDGLYYRYVHNNSRYSKDILITRDYRRYLEFIGLPDDGKIEYKSFEDVYNYMITSKYFNPDYFKLENLTQIDRKRNRKRPTYNVFLEYVNSIDFGDKEYLKIDRSKVFDTVADFFTEVDLRKIVDKIEGEANISKIVRDRCSGNTVLKLFPDMKQSGLTNFMKEFYDTFGGKIACGQHIATLTDSEIGDLIKKHYLKKYNTFYHGTTFENWEKIVKERMLFGERKVVDEEGKPSKIYNNVSRCTYLATDIEEAKCYGDVLLEIHYDPTLSPKYNNYVDGCWQFRVYEPILIENIKRLR